MSRRDRLGEALPVSFAILAAAALAGCNSKNPDALTGANLDENLAAVDLNGTVNAQRNAAVTNVTAQSNEAVADMNADSDGAVADSHAAVASAEEPPEKEVAASAQANVDAAVNSLREIDAEENEYCEAEMQAAGENDDCDD